jgi:hypothetical protein
MHKRPSASAASHTTATGRGCKGREKSRRCRPSRVPELDGEAAATVPFLPPPSGHSGVPPTCGSRRPAPMTESWPPTGVVHLDEYESGRSVSQGSDKRVLLSPVNHGWAWETRDQHAPRGGHAGPRRAEFLLAHRPQLQSPYERIALEGRRTRLQRRSDLRPSAAIR